jgi:predicted ATP-dependent serine protease
LAKRVAEAGRLGFRGVIIPADAGASPDVVRAAEGLEVLPVARLADLLGAMRQAPPTVQNNHPVDAPF